MKGRKSTGSRRRFDPADVVQPTNRNLDSRTAEIERAGKLAERNRTRKGREVNLDSALRLCEFETSRTIGIRHSGGSLWLGPKVGENGRVECARASGQVMLFGWPQ
jgi:hypothetical protein